MVKRARFLSRWLGLLFWLFIPNAITALMTGDAVMKSYPDIYRIGQILDLVCPIFYGLILIRLSSEEARYRTAGICNLICAAVIVLDFVFPEGTGNFPEGALAALIVDTIGMYYEYKAHSAVLADVYEILSKKWMILWKWCFGIMIALFCFMILGLLIVPSVGVIGILLATIALAVVSIVKLVYLYRTVDAFKAFL